MLPSEPINEAEVLEEQENLIENGRELNIQYEPIKEVYAGKGGFFFRKRYLFFKSPNLKKKYFKTILNLKVKFPAKNNLLLLAGNLNFKFRKVFWNIFFLRFGDLKNNSHFLKESHL